MTEKTVKGWVQTNDGQSYDVWVPDDLSDQMTDGGDEGWVSLALIFHDAYICLRAKDIMVFRRLMTALEIERRHIFEVKP